MLPFKRIYLWGFMGSGKTTVGRALSKIRNTSFIDTDKQVEIISGMSISTLFQSYDEIFFREREREVLQHTILLYDTVIATGGGTPTYKKQNVWMNEMGKTIYLKVPFEFAWDRIVQARHTRPMIKSKEQMYKLYSEREALYQTAQYIVSGTQSLRSLTNQIQDLLQ